MTHRFTLTLRTQTKVTAKWARETLLNALTSGGLCESRLRLTAIPKAKRLAEIIPFFR